MSHRNMLPRFQSGRNPVNVAPAATREWVHLQDPSALAMLDFGKADDRTSRTDVQSIPSPWARMLLFQNALEDPNHPARRLVANELLDAFEFIWTLDTLNVQFTVRPLSLAALPVLASASGARRVVDFATAVGQLRPRGLTHLDIAMVGSRPVFASSPFTLLFTAEDAHAALPGSTFFRYAQTGTETSTTAKTEADRPLRERQMQFQEYMATVIYPQLQSPPLPADMVRLLVNWLNEELAGTAFAGASAQVNWSNNADVARLKPGPRFQNVQLFKGGGVLKSRWVLRSTRTDQRPLVVSPAHFDGHYFLGSPPVRLPTPLPRSRDVLPGLGVRFDWVNPEADWLVDRIQLLADPIDTRRVKGLGRYRWHGARDDEHFGTPRMLLPLRSAIFAYFSPDEIEDMLSIEILPSRTISVTLKVPVGDDNDTIVIQRTYEPSAVTVDPPGPGIAVWPSFTWTDDAAATEPNSWHRYTVFRRDTREQVASDLELVGSINGRILPKVNARRTFLVEAISFEQPPEVIEFIDRAAASGTNPSMGVILPRFGPRRATQAVWHVGVDFGTSNTVVCVRVVGEREPELFAYDQLLLPLTEPIGEMPESLAAFFFPARLERRAFGTAVVHLADLGLKTPTIQSDRLGVRVNIPYTGHVQINADNRVAGDLKWSTDAHVRFLSTTFIRHLLATVVAEALLRGVHPSNISFSYSHPLAFTSQDRDTLAGIWREAMQALPVSLGRANQTPRAVEDESKAALRHFFNTHDFATGGDTNVIVDIGGGTTDIAAYGNGTTVLLDSVLLGGRELTGLRLHGSDPRGNPFVEAFVEWAGRAGMSESDLKLHQDVVKAYMQARQVHLAFGYLMTTEWFRSGRAAGFVGQPAFDQFQALVFYFFGALFYYLGLSLRLPDATQERRIEGLPRKVVLAGNGSRYMDWLTSMQPSYSQDDAFRRSFARLLASGAGVDDLTHAAGIEINVSPTPKEEVARGLVAEVDPARLNDSGAARGSALGEAIAVSIGGARRKYAAHERFATDESIVESTIIWPPEPLEIERFHDALLRECAAVAVYGGPYKQLAQKYRDAFRSIGRARIEQGTRHRIEHQVSKHKEYRGSVFILEASVVLEHLMDVFFERQPGKTASTRDTHPVVAS